MYALDIFKNGGQLFTLINSYNILKSKVFINSNLYLLVNNIYIVTIHLKGYDL
jgi:hypothetical protein